ncbi:ATP-dependent helicase [Candidatus Saccharibacteria bacterium]|nr:ATP-dependent helicase [Candidatus Saccharibacteria bacterium]
MEFKKRYRSLNANQKKAVDTTDGPVMVVAGPGTGKTELLSVRVANILATTDTLPHNILCLTFTDSAATNMRERLAGLIGPEAYKVAIHTFHSFGSEIINQHAEYFYHGAHFRPADELSSYEILSEILEKLPHGNPLAGTMNGEFTHLRDIQSTISDLKKSGLTPDELGTILDHNDAFCAWVAPRLATAFGDRLSKKSFAGIQQLISDIAGYQADEFRLIGYTPLWQLILDSLQTALTDAEAEGSTKPLSAWKKRYLTKDAHDQPILRDQVSGRKLRALGHVYYDYLVAMEAAELYDYDDMILRVVHRLEVSPELRFDLQELYQYVMVDEFQDTNDAQMRLIWNLTNNPVSEGQPNLMVVGDDDQAIYRFQGATMSNIIDFTSRYRDVTVVTLRDNYRSVAGILALARSVIVQGEERLETRLGIDKSLIPHRDEMSMSPDEQLAYLAKRGQDAKARSVGARAAARRGDIDVSVGKANSPAGDVPATGFSTYASEHEARHALAEQIAANYRADSSRSRAVIARHHRQLIALLPHLQATGVPLRYERHDDVLETEPVLQLELVARIVHAIASQQFDEVSELLPELLAHPAWHVSPRDIWELSIAAHRAKRFWLEEMLERPGRLQQIAEWLIVASHYSLSEPLEYMCDYLFGVVDAQQADTPTDEATGDDTQPQEEFISPYRAYFFATGSLDTQPGAYLAYLSALQTIRSRLREFRSDRVLTLHDLVEFLDLHRDMNLSLQSKGDVEYDASAVVLLSAHKAKGLEFDDVYLTDAHENIWGASARARSRLISFPSNLPLAPVGDSDDERLRLLYVALTRARDRLTLVAARTSDAGKDLLPVGSIPTDVLPTSEHDELGTPELVAAVEHDWRTPLLDVPTATKDQLLRPLLERYKLSATHLNNFLDVTRGGPQLFLLHNLLRFPQAMGPSAAYGSAIHTTLQRAHAHLASTGKRRPVEDILHDFDQQLRQFQLSDLEYGKQLQRGSDTLTEFLRQRYDSFTTSQLVERSFATESVLIGDAVITGAIDLIDIDTDEKTIYITDYKTGKAVNKWQGRTDYEKIKLHHYEQQLMMYKLLVENSRQFTGYTVTGARIEFVEPNEKNDVVLLDYAYDEVKLADFRRLLSAVWQRIQALDFDLPAEYSLDYKGIIAFEDDLTA